MNGATLSYLITLSTRCLSVRCLGSYTAGFKDAAVCVKGSVEMISRHFIPVAYF